MFSSAFFQHSFAILNGEGVSYGIPGVGPIPRAEPKT